MKKYIKIYTFLIILCALAINSLAQSDTLITKKGINSDKINIAYGDQKKATVSSSISTISGEELLKGSISNLGNALYGRLPGLFVTQTSGEPGNDSPTIRLRGASNAPLVMIDGFERDMTYIAPEEIEFVSVLKDASALALYGMKGANGAILITTKRGNKQEGKITVSLQSGMQSPQKTMEILNAKQYMDLYNVAAANDGLANKYSQNDIDAAGTSPRYPDVDWQDLILKKMTNISKANIGLKGGSDFIKYFVNFGFLFNNGIYKPENPDMSSNANLTRMNLRTNIDVNISKNTQFSMDLAGSINKNVIPAFNTSTIWNTMFTLPPNAFNAVNPDNSYGGTSLLLNNPLAIFEKGGSNNSIDHFLNAGFRLRQNFDFITEGLSASLGYVIDNGANNSDGSWRYFQVRQIAQGTGENYQYYTYRENTQYNEWSNANSNRFTTFEGDITYNMPEWNGNKLDVLIRYQSDQQYKTNNDISPYLTNNYGARISYAKNNTYLLEMAASYYGSDQYAEGEKFGVFPSVSAGWVFSNEKFIGENENFNYGKLKASYGINGLNRYVNGRYPFNQFYTGGGSFPLGTGWNVFNGIQLGMLANPDIKWEISKKMNVGIELEFMKNFTLDADYYVNERSDVLYIDYNNPSTIGLSLPYENIGKISESGFDMKLGYRSSNEKLKWSADLIFSYFSNTIDEMGESKNTGALESLNRTGQRVSSIFGYEVAGRFENASDIQSSPKQTFGTVRVGDLKYKDLNNDKIIDSRDMTVIGNAVANIDFGVKLGLEYKNFDVEALLQSQMNNDINLSGNELAQPFIQGNSISEIALEDGFPTLTLSNMNNYQNSSYWIRNGDFVKLRNLEVGYTLPQNILTQINIQKARIFVRGENMLTLSKWKFTDPEYTAIGYPPMKTFLLGVNINF